MTTTINAIIATTTAPAAIPPIKAGDVKIFVDPALSLTADVIPPLPLTTLAVLVEEG